MTVGRWMDSHGRVVDISSNGSGYIDNGSLKSAFSWVSLNDDENLKLKREDNSSNLYQTTRGNDKQIYLKPLSSGAEYLDLFPITTEDGALYKDYNNSISILNTLETYMRIEKPNVLDMISMIKDMNITTVKNTLGTVTTSCSDFLKIKRRLGLGKSFLADSDIDRASRCVALYEIYRFSSDPNLVTGQDVAFRIINEKAGNYYIAGEVARDTDTSVAVIQKPQDNTVGVSF